MKTQEFTKQWSEHMSYLDNSPPFCQFCGKHHLDIENCLPCDYLTKITS